MGSEIDDGPEEEESPAVPGGAEEVTGEDREALVFMEVAASSGGRLGLVSPLSLSGMRATPACRASSPSCRLRSSAQLEEAEHLGDDVGHRPGV
jgi:hypothetical protein